jgi:hypothetical protein
MLQWVVEQDQDFGVKPKVTFLPNQISYWVSGVNDGLKTAKSGGVISGR